MDREMREEYLVVIQAKDMGGHMGGLSGTTTVTVILSDVNDNPPKFSKSKVIHIYKDFRINYFIYHTEPLIWEMNDNVWCVEKHMGGLLTIMLI